MHCARIQEPQHGRLSRDGDGDWDGETTALLIILMVIWRHNELQIVRFRSEYLTGATEIDGASVMAGGWLSAMILMIVSIVARILLAPAGRRRAKCAEATARTTERPPEFGERPRDAHRRIKNQKLRSHGLLTVWIKDGKRHYYYYRKLCQYTEYTPKTCVRSEWV